MSAANDTQLHRYLTDDARPATFLERGVSVPFTTPVLFGSRVRPGQREVLELAVPNPAGVRGLYIVPLLAIRDICTPTLHDRLITDVLMEHRAVTPNVILQVARAAAQEGLAGREAAAAAAAADGAVSSQRLLTNFKLLMLLIRQTELSAPGQKPAELDTAGNVQARAKSAVARVADELGLPSEIVVAALEGLADAYLDVGLKGNPTDARYQRQLNDLEKLAAEVSAWGEAEIDPHQAGSALLVSRSAILTLSCGRVILDELLAPLTDLRALLLRWIHNAEGIRKDTGRLAWLLDGWGVISGIWNSAERCGTSSAIREMAVLVPTMPQEVSNWVGGQEEQITEVQGRRSRFVSRLEDWRTGRTLELVERNELIVRNFM